MSDVAKTVAVGNREGEVVFEFEHPVRWAAFDPQTALAISEATAREAYTVQYGKPPSSGSAMSTEIKSKLVVRTMHIIRSLQEQKKSARYVAEAVLDAILREVM